MGMLKNRLSVGDVDAKQWPGAPRSRKRLLTVAALAASVAGAWGAPAHALLTGGPDIIAAPSSVLNSNTVDVPAGATNTHQQAFNEQQGVVLTAPLAVDHGAIPAGTVVDST